MTREEVRKRVIDIFSYLSRTDPVFFNDNMIPYADLGIDSLDFTEVKFEIEKYFGIDTKDKINQEHTIKEIVDVVYMELNNQ